MTNVLFLANDRRSWILRDRDLLARHYRVVDLFLDRRSILAFWTWGAMLLRADVVFAWFGSFLFLPVLLCARLGGKKVVIVAGGFDVAKDPILAYGSFAKGPVERFFRRLLFRTAHRVLAVSDANLEEARTNARIPQARLVRIHHGFEAPALRPTPWEERARRVVMIANVFADKIEVKGIDQLLAIAEAMPEVEFVLVGGIGAGCEHLPAEAPANLEFAGELAFDGTEFNATLLDARIALQLSHYESFGAAVVDAALRGCYPIVCDRMALPEVVGALGTVVPHGEIAALAAAIRRVLDSRQDCEQIRAAFLDRFGLEERERALHAMIEDLGAR